MKKILIIENYGNLRKLYKQEFSNDGYKVFDIDNGHDAIDVFKECHPDLVILDIVLPDADGLRVMGELLSINKNLPVIINSAYSQFMDDFHSWAAKDFVIKSSDLTELKQKVAAYI